MHKIEIQCCSVDIACASVEGSLFFRSFFMSEAVWIPPGPRSPVKTETGEVKRISW